MVSVALRGNISSLRDYVFDNCGSLRCVTIPESVTMISKGAFRGCRSLRDVYFGGSEEQWERIHIHEENEPLFDAEIHFQAEADRDSTRLGAYDDGGWSLDADGLLTLSGGPILSGDPWLLYRSDINALVIQKGVTSIVEGCFRGCGHMQTVRLPKGLKSILPEAFQDCCALRAVTFRDGLETIGSGAFQGCRSLKLIELPNTVKTVGDYSFEDCCRLTAVTIPENLAYIGTGAFHGCASLEDVYYGGSEEQWKNISISEENEALFNAVVHFQ